MCFDSENFEYEPNFIYKETISNEADCLSNCDTFDYYKEKNNDIILVIPTINPINFDNKDFYINLINLNNNNEIIKKLQGHKERITTLKILINPKTKKEYLISADKGENIIVWDIQDNFKKIFQRKFEYEPYCFIYSTLIIFSEKNTFIVASSISEKNKTLIVDINKPQNLIEIKNSENLPVYCLCYWFNEEAEDDRDKHNIIQCGKNKILITQFQRNETYYEIITDEKYAYNSGGLVFNVKDKDYLAISATSGLILIFDLINKNIVKKIELENVHIFSFVKWNDSKLLLIDMRFSKIIIIDINDNYKIISKNYIPELGIASFMKKIRHPNYGECFLINDKKWKIKLFALRGIRKKVLDDEDD